MAVEGKWWVLYEEEPLDMERSRFYELREGKVLDGRTGHAIGRYEEGEQLTNVTLDDEPSDNTIFQFGIGSGTTSADVCSINWTTSGFELYRSSWPISLHETEEEEWAREDWENKHFGQRLAYDSALRDGPRIRELHIRNQPDLLSAAIH